jgi:MSHA biogenesis protein MshG
MAVFAYSGRKLDGSLVEAEIEAASIGEAASLLKDAQVTPVRIAPRAGAEAQRAGAAWSFSLTRERVTTEDLILLCRQLHRLARAGIPILRSIASLAEETPNQALATALAEVSADLRGGRELSAALARHPRIFPHIVTSVIQVGETTGRLDEAYDQLARYLELERETARRATSAMRYPAMVIVAIVAAIGVVNVFVIPSFAKVFEGFGSELPWPTRMLMKSSDLTLAYWPHALIVAAAVAWGIRAWVRTPAGRLAWDARKLRLPLVGRILRSAAVGRYARAFAMSLSAGVPLLHALQGVARGVENTWFAERVLAMRTSLERGESLTRAAAASGLFPRLFQQKLSVGEESGALAEMHEEIADSCDADVAYELKRLTDLIEPVLIVLIAAAVFVLALGVYLPMWDLARAAKGGG